ncbi:MAG: sigma-70 family RNA polymerase sigma factor [Solirubrobacteraceae bacterium]
MEVSALKYSGGIGLHGRSPLLRLQSDERLITLVRRGNSAAFEMLVSRYESRLLSFCRHLLGSREDAEDVLQEVMASAYNAILADERDINVRPWLYRIARNRSLNHLRRIQAVAVDTMDSHLSDHGASTADKVHAREVFRLLVGDIHELPESQRTALVLREMDALSYEQIAAAMETTVPSVKSLLVRARVSLAEAAEARLLSCEEVRIELGEVAEGLRRRPGPLVRRHLKACRRCASFQTQLKETTKALAAVLPIGPLVVLKKFVLTHLSHSGTGAGATAGGAGAGAAGGGLLAGSGGFVSAGFGAIATKAAAGLAAAALVTAGAVEVDHVARPHGHAAPTAQLPAVVPVIPAAGAPGGGTLYRRAPAPERKPARRKALRVAGARHASIKPVLVVSAATAETKSSASAPTDKLKASGTPPAASKTKTIPAAQPGQTVTQTVPTVLPPAPASASPSTGATVVGTPTTPSTPGTASPTVPAQPPTTTPGDSTSPPATASTPPSGSTTATTPAGSTPTAALSPFAASTPPAPASGSSSPTTTSGTPVLS